VGGVRKASAIAAAVAIAGIVAAAISPSAAYSAGANEEASSLIADRCAVCHGENGDGQGPAASNLNPPPQDFHSRKWQKSVSDETLTKAIMLGGPAVGLSASMPGNPDLINRPEVVAAMVKQIRAWGK
jgi:mono/diheme cytochrome c family protein